MNVVVVGYVCVVVVLQRHHEGNKCADWDLKGFQKVSLLEQKESQQPLDLIHISHGLSATIIM